MERFTYTSVQFLAIFAAATCSEVFYNPIEQIYRARSVCQNDTTIKPECTTSCALEGANMLTSSGDGINVTEFGNYYTPLAEKCFTYKAKPTCEEANKFFTCFEQSINDQMQEVTAKCLGQYPDVDLEHARMSEEQFAQYENLACFTACDAEGTIAFKENYQIDLGCINPHIRNDFNAAEAAKVCENRFKEGSECFRKANIYLCLIDAYEEAETKRYENN